ncbi:hypothetical protein DRE_06538 [Drechslerella stenobrocha 248]|uniref:Uncharacterized protein n=1 Tax=Drechslerella stenobrocha 248 TaxID=1043628 RepID=W7I724_9PEZI|nr:hypothetical protein DRE_06538 [Drechslerella stenobrocha 248]
MPCAAPYIPGNTYHTSPPDASDDVKTLMRHGFRIVDSRGMENWEVLQTNCTALLFKKHWDRMDYRIALENRQRSMDDWGNSPAAFPEKDPEHPEPTRQCKCVIV